MNESNLKRKCAHADPLETIDLYLYNGWSLLLPPDLLTCHTSGHIDSCTTTLQDTLQDEGGPPVLELDLEDAYQRLLTHGIATYYKLQSRTDATGRTLLESTGRGSQSNASTQQITCADICFAISQDNPGGLTAQALYGYWKRLHYGTDADSEASYVIL